MGEVKIENIFKRQIPKHMLIFRKSKILILGCGGLGINLCFMFAKSGVGHAKIVDYGTAEYFNLSKQTYRSTDVGKYKVDTFKEVCDEFLPFTNISVKNIRITENNISELTDDYGIVLEASDDEYAKPLVPEHFIETDKKLVSVSGIGGMKKLNMKIKEMNNIAVCGDFETRTDIGLYYPNVIMATGIQAIAALSWLLRESNGR